MQVWTSTLTVAPPLLESAVAVMVADPGATPVRIPDASTLTIAGASLIHVTTGPTRRLPLASSIIARSWAVPFVTIERVAGDTLMSVTAPPPRTAVHVPVPDEH